MSAFFRNLFLLVSSAPIVLGVFLGPTYPYPTDLSSDQSLVQAAWQDLCTTFDAYFKDGKHTAATTGLAGTKDLTFSASLFSLEDPSATELQYHFTGPQIANSTYGTKQVNSNSVYRVASVTKLMTVLTGLLELDDDQWNKPISQILPELARGKMAAYAPSWDEITPWTLAQQISGIQQLGIIGDLFVQFTQEALAENKTLAEIEVENGLPPISLSVVGPCSSGDCTESEFISTAENPAPVFQPYFTPGYSDLGLMLLGEAISRITGKPFNTLYQDALFDPLEMESSFVNAPTSGTVFQNSVIAGPVNGSWSYPYNNPTIPSGGILSTITDLNKLGTGILNSTLLSPVQTRQWMKPHTHTASFSYSVGAPWEIVRYVHIDTGKITDIYTKLGDSGAYGGMLAIIPDYQAGFTFLNALYQPPGEPQTRGTLALQVINYIAEAVIPALEAQAAKEAASNFVGTYVSTNANDDSKLDIAFNQSTVKGSNLGLNLQSWTSNGTDMIKEQFGGLLPQMLLSIPRQQPHGDQVTFQLSLYPQWDSYTDAGLGPFTGFYESNFDWFTYDGSRYAGASLDTFRFQVDEKGLATEVTNLGTRSTLKRKGS